MIRKQNQNQSEPKLETLVPLPDAAPLLGIAYDTARKRLQAGTLRGEKHGGRWLVWVPADNATAASLESLPVPVADPERVSGPIPVSDPEETTAIPDDKPEDSGPIPDQTGRDADAVVLQLREEVAFLRQQVERQNHLLAGLIQRLPELPASQDAPVAAREPQPEAAPVSMAPATPSSWWASWWRRLLGGNG